MAGQNIADVFYGLWTYKFYGIPVVQVLIIVLILYFLYVLIRRFMGAKPQYKTRKWKEELKDYNYEDLVIGFPVNKTLIFRYPIRHIMTATIHKGKPRITKEKVKGGKEVITIKYDNIGKNSWKLKTRPLGLVPKLLSMFGFGIKFFSIDETLILSDANNEMRINPTADYVVDSGVFIFGGVSKDINDNVSYIKHSENISESLINHLPKLEFLNTDLSFKAALKREEAEIEKEKYKGQVD